VNVLGFPTVTRTPSRQVYDLPNANVALLGFVLTDGALDGVGTLDDGTTLDDGATLDCGATLVGVGVSKGGGVSSGLAPVVLTQAEHSNAATVPSNPGARRLTNRDLTGG
jgi:hypothetical protein